MRYFLVPIVLAAAVLGCEKRIDAASTAPDVSAAPVPSSAPSAVTWHLSIDAKGTAHVDMPGAATHIVGDTTAAMGSLEVTPSDLAQSRGAVMIDLGSFSTHTFNNADDAKQTKQAAAWLDLVGPSATSFRWASFAIRSVDGLSANDLTKVAPSKDGSDDVRTVTMTLHGDLLLHGHKVQRDTVVGVSFRHPAGAPADSKPTRVDIVSKDPMNVVLKDFDVRLRDATIGAVAPPSAKPSASAASSANVTVDLSATPGP